MVRGILNPLLEIYPNPKRSSESCSDHRNRSRTAPTRQNLSETESWIRYIPSLDHSWLFSNLGPQSHTHMVWVCQVRGQCIIAPPCYRASFYVTDSQ